jgi:hypothetical protein
VLRPLLWRHFDTLRGEWDRFAGDWVASEQVRLALFVCIHIGFTFQSWKPARLVERWVLVRLVVGET